MDRVLNPKDEKQTIYEIYRACRLCGAGAGYKMPIIQNVIDLDGDGVDLRHKIKECVQIEVNHTDRMPPLICELCVDKVNEFYEFLDMCKQTNKRTRLRLGLPLQAWARDSVDSENCILGVTEPVFNESDAKHRSKKTAIKKEPAEVKIKIENFRPSPKPELKTRERSRESRESSEEPRWASTSRNKRRLHSPTPKRTTRQNVESGTPQIEEPALIEKSKLKRPREKEVKMDTPPPTKKVKMAPEPVKFSKPGPKSLKIAQKEPIEPPTPPKITPRVQLAKPASKKDIKPSPPPKPAPKNSKALPSETLPSKALPPKALPPKALPSKALPSKALPSKALPSKALPSKALPSKATPSPAASKAYYCQICKVQAKSSQGFAQHNTKHYVNFTSPKQACNACELWFPSIDEANTHHRNHRTENIPYKCTRCYGYFKLQHAYEEHFANDLCLSVYEVPDVKCWECWRTFPTNKLMEEHKCAGEDGRPGGKCNKCNRSYALLKNLIKHESTCTYKKKGELAVDPEVLARMLPMQVRIARCDPLLTDGYVHSSTVSHRYGLDSKCRYPYLSNTRVKPEPKEPFQPMVSIDQEVKEEFCESFVGWDSDDSDSSQKKVDSLSTMSLKTIFAKKGIGKVPKKKLNVKSEFGSNVDFGMAEKIDSIIDNLNEKIDNIIGSLADEDAQTSCSYDSDSILDKSIAKDSLDVKLDEAKKDNNDFVKDSKNISPIILKDDSQTGSCDSDSIIDKSNDKSDSATDKVEGKVSDDTVKCDVTTEKVNVTSESCKVTLDKMDVSSENLDETSGKCDDKSQKLDIDSIPVNSEQETVDNSNENNEESMKERRDFSKSSVQSDMAPNDVSTNDEKVIRDDINKSEDTETFNKNSNKQIDGYEQSRVQNDSIATKQLETSNETENAVATNEHDSKNDNVDRNNKLILNNTECLKTENNLIDDDNTKANSEEMDVDEQNHAAVTKISVTVTNLDDVAKNLEHTSENNENFTKIDEITNKILKDNQTDVISNVRDDTHSTHYNNEDNHQRSDPSFDSISLNSMKSENGIDIQDKFNVNDLNEDDRKLMAELDEQIGENDKKLVENDQRIVENDQRFVENDMKLVENDQNDQKNIQRSKDHSIDDILRKQDVELRSLDLDSISDDEFNFDV